jgi:hypothetical protein
MEPELLNLFKFDKYSIHLSTYIPEFVLGLKIEMGSE